MNSAWQAITSQLSMTPLKQHDAAEQNLPALFICPLDDLAVVNLQGDDSQKYLQGQLTCDVDTLDNQHFLHYAHCDAKGKMWSIGKVFTMAEQFFLCSHQQESQASLVQLNKYGVFAKTTITDVSESYLWVGIGGEQAEQCLAQHWQISLTDQTSAIDLHNNGNLVGKALKVGPARFLLMLAAAELTPLLTAHPDQCYDPELWNILTIQGGLSHLTEPTINQFVPQNLNLQCLDAISFTKGCYSGQEMVARMKYLGKNKRATFLLSGTADSRPLPGDDLQLMVADNWRRGGTIINVSGQNDRYYLLAMMPNDLDLASTFRLKDQPNSTFTICPLPYSLQTDE